jgi:hypothetical protein
MSVRSDPSNLATSFPQLDIYRDDNSCLPHLFCCSTTRTRRSESYCLCVSALQHASKSRWREMLDSDSWDDNQTRRQLIVEMQPSRQTEEYQYSMPEAYDEEKGEWVSRKCTHRTARMF